MHSEPYAVTGQQEARYREVQPVDLPIYTAKPWLPVKASESVALSLCDGLGCAALSLKKVGWDEVGVDRIIAVEKSKTARKVCDAANPATDTFPGVDHGLNGKHDITLITEEDIRTMPRGTLKLFLAGPMCVDFCKLRLLPDRESYKGPKTPPGQDPRPGLDGKYGMTFRVTIKIWGWVQKYHPECRFFIENVVFDDMKEDWAEVCDALGKPIIVCADEISHTKRNRAYWTNIDVPEDWRDGLSPRDPDTCMDPGRTVQTYPAFGKDCVRPLGASWSDGPEGPVANTGRPLLVNDQTKDEAQHVRPHEAEKLMGMDAGTTAGPGITAKQRLQAIGGGWDINVTSVLLQHLKPRSVQAYTSMYLAKLATSATTTDMEQGEHFLNMFQGDMEKVATYSKSLQEHAGIAAVGKMLAAMIHYENVVYQESLKRTSVLDSGAARHVHPDVIITDTENRTRLSSFTGEDVWTDGVGYIPCEFHDDLTSKPFKLDIDDADYVKGITCTLISMGKLIKQGWKFTFELAELIGWTPSGHKVQCTLGDDNVIRIPHGVRTGDEAAELPIPAGDYSIGTVSNSKESATSAWLHATFNHASQDKIWHTLGVTAGFKQPAKPFEDCFCTACATANARGKGLKHSQYSHQHGWNSTCPSSVAFGQDIADLGVEHAPNRPWSTPSSMLLWRTRHGPNMPTTSMQHW